jgi:hypothetical protein
MLETVDEAGKRETKRNLIPIHIIFYTTRPEPSESKQHITANCRHAKA